MYQILLFFTKTWKKHYNFHIKWKMSKSQFPQKWISCNMYSRNGSKNWGTHFFLEGAFSSIWVQDFHSTWISSKMLPQFFGAVCASIVSKMKQWPIQCLNISKKYQLFYNMMHFPYIFHGFHALPWGSCGQKMMIFFKNVLKKYETLTKWWIFIGNSFDFS